MTRYKFKGHIDGSSGFTIVPVPTDGGEYVPYSDHKAALDRAEKVVEAARQAGPRYALLAENEYDKAKAEALHAAIKEYEEGGK